MKESNIRWRTSARFKSDAEAAAKIISKAQRRSPDQICQAVSVVNAARPVGSPIHEDFEWDDAAAAELHRTETARNMIRSLVVVVESGEPEPLFVNVRIGDVRGYMPTRVALSRLDARTSLLNEAHRDAKTFRLKYSRLKEMSAVIQAIDQIVEAA